MNLRSIPIAAVLAATSLLPLNASVAQQKTPKTKKAPAAAPAPVSPVPAPAGTPIAKEQIVRTAICTLTLKGRTEMQVQVESKDTKTKRNKRIVEDFSYTLPGQLSESLYPNGETDFTFTPSDSLGTSGAEARLHLEDDFPAPGWAPIAMDATQLQNAGPMVFRSLARGQNIVPLGGAVVNLKGSMKSLAPMTVSKALGETENRPVASTPIPRIQGDLHKQGLPILRFQGPSLWAWVNSPGGCVLRGTIEYPNYKNLGKTINGAIDFTFQVGPIQKASQ